MSDVCSDEVYGVLQAIVVSGTASPSTAQAFERLRQARMRDAGPAPHNTNETAALRAENGSQAATPNRPIRDDFIQAIHRVIHINSTGAGALADEILKLWPREWVERNGERRTLLDTAIIGLARRNGDRRTVKSPTTREQELEAQVERLKTDNQKLRDEADKLLFSSSQYRDELAALKSRPAPEQPMQAPITAEQLAEALAALGIAYARPPLCQQVLDRLSIPSPDPQAQADLALGKNVRKVLENPKLYHYFRLDKNSTGQWTACNYMQQVEADTPDAAVEMLAGRVGG